MRRLPPLNAMKAFETTARTGSFALAALELGVSSAAVSQQVRNLESYFGKLLFTRNGNRIFLTDAGQSIFPQASRSFGEIAELAYRLLEGEVRNRLVVSVPYSLAELWLAPRLVELLEIYPQMSFDIVVEDDPVDLKLNNIDLRIGYGDYLYPGQDVIHLFQDEVFPVCTPEFWAKFGGEKGLADIPDNLLIHTNWGQKYASQPTWADWFETAQMPRRPDPSKGRRVALSSLAITTARLGLGVALGQKHLMAQDLGAGSLMAVSPISVKLGHSYFALTTKETAARSDVQTLIALLTSKQAPH